MEVSRIVLLTAAFVLVVAAVGIFSYQSISSLGSEVGVLKATRGIGPGAITAERVATGAVTTVKIADSAVTTAKLEDSAVTSAKIADGTIVATDIASGAVTSAKILDGAIETVDIKDSAVTTAKIADTNVTTSKLADSAVTSAKLADNIEVENLYIRGTIGPPTAFRQAGENSISGGGTCGAGGDREITKEISFPTAFDAAPTVVVSPGAINEWTNLYYPLTIRVEDITTDGFTAALRGLTVYQGKWSADVDFYWIAT